MDRTILPAPPALDTDHEALAAELAALAYPARLELLEQLHFPRTLSKLRVRARRAEKGAPAAGVSSKQAILGHLSKLRAAGIVTVEDVAGAPTYAVDPQRFYAIVESLRDVGARHAGRGRSADKTGTLRAGPTAASAKGPRLVVVHGLYEGQAYALKGEGPWSIGRARTTDVVLDYDPYVSTTNAHVERHAFGYRIRDHENSKNGTRVNWNAVSPRGAKDLQQGDIIGVGKSLLAFYEG